MKIERLAVPGPLLLEPTRHSDERGYFCETWQAERYHAAGVPVTFVQDNLSYSRYGTLRGLHFQQPPQGKLVFVLAGEIYDVAVDLRVGSAFFGRWVAVTLSAANAQQLYIPAGFAHGFCVTGLEALVMYKCTDRYLPGAQHSLAWNDPALGIPWPVREPLLSPRDRQAPTLADVPLHLLGGDTIATSLSAMET